MKEQVFYQGRHDGFAPLASGTRRYGAEVVFGNPKDNCKGVGICHLVFSPQDFPGLPCRSGLKTRCVVAHAAPGELWLSFAREQLSAHLAELYFSGNCFCNPRMFLISQYPGLPKGHAPIRVPAGLYPISHVGNQIHVYFKLT